MSCTKGCAHCCQILAAASVPEMLMAAWYAEQLGHQLNGAEIQRQYKLVKQISSTADWRQRQISCPLLLSDQSCSAYQYRPVACRTYVTFNDPADCAIPCHPVKMLDTRQYSFQSMLQIGSLFAQQLGLSTHGIGPLPISLWVGFLYLRRGKREAIKLMQQLHMDEPIRYLNNYFPH